jgi:hypothetical protein
MQVPKSWIPAGLVLALGVAVLSMRHRTLSGLRERVRPETTSAVVSPTPPSSPVPASLLRLRGEHQSLRRSLEDASNRLAVLSKTWEFDPGTMRPAQSEWWDEFRRLGQGPEQDAAVALGRALASYLEQHEGRLPASLGVLADAGLDGAAAGIADGGYELLQREPVPGERRSLSYVASSGEIPLAGGRSARFFLKGDGTVVLASVEDRSDWDGWVAEQEAREKAASGQ